MKVCACIVRNNELLEVDSKKLLKVGLFSMALSSGNPVLAAVDIKTGVQPLVDIIVDLAEPVYYAGMIKGALQMAIGNEHEGKKAIGNATKGYLVVKFAPLIFDIIDGIEI